MALRMLRSVKCLQKSSKLDHAGCSSLARDLNLEAGDKWIGRKKNAHISWYPGPNHEFLSPNELLESILQPGLVHLDGHVFTLRGRQCLVCRSTGNTAVAKWPRKSCLADRRRGETCTMGKGTKEKPRDKSSKGKEDDGEVENVKV